MKSKIKNKTLSLILAAVMLLSLSVTAFAAHVTPELSKTEIHAGETVDVILNINEEVSNITSLQYDVYYDTTLFEFTSATQGTSNNLVDAVSMTDSNGDAIVRVMYIDTSVSGGGNPQTFMAAPLYTLSFTAKSDLDADATASFRVLEKGLMNANFTSLRDKTYNGILSVTIKVEQPLAAGYTVTVSPAAQTLNPGEMATVHVNVNSGDVEKYNAVDMSFDYDSNCLRLLTTSIDGLTVTDTPWEIPNSGYSSTIRVYGCGDDRAVNTGFDLQFECIKDVSSTMVRLTSAKVGESEQAISSDAPEATVDNNASVITVSMYTVTYDPACADWFNTTGATSAEVNGYVIFGVKDNHYDYDFTGTTVGGVSTEVVASSSNKFRINNINGPVYVTATRTPKQYDVEVSGTAAADVKAEDGSVLPEKGTYLSDFVFILDKDEAYTYTGPVVTVNGTEKTLTPEGNKYTIPGADVIGTITIAVDKEAIAADKFDVTGLGGDVTGDEQATAGQPYTFTVSQDPNYDYTIEVAVSSVEVTPTDNENGTYTIPGEMVTGPITISVTKTAKARVVEISEYLKLDGKSIYLVVVKDTLEEGKAFTYDGNTMFVSDKYQGYAYLTIETEELTTEAAAAKTSQSTAEMVELEYIGDVNMTYKTDINDAQLVYDIYNLKYSDFSRVVMEKFLRADVNGDKKVDTNDVTATVNLISKN